MCVYFLLNAKSLIKKTTSSHNLQHFSFGIYNQIYDLVSQDTLEQKEKCLCWRVALI